jgi:DNA polymerase I-like protein with 3'-5' exonuclease and polymerase domains
LLESPVTKVFQNGLYDLQYIYQMGIRPRNCTEDTMLMHHALYPEMKKGLEFLGSVYTNEASWKLMRKHTNQDQIKADA